MRKKFVVSVTLVTVSGIFPSPLWQGQTMFLTLSVFFTAVPYENIADAATFRFVRRGRKKHDLLELLTEAPKIMPSAANT